MAGVKHTTAADGTFSSTGATEWNRVHDFEEAGSSAILTIGAIADGQEVVRSGTVLQGKWHDVAFVLGGDTATSVATGPATISGMVFPIASGVPYNFSARLLHRRPGAAATSTTVGLRLSLTFPSAVVVRANVKIPQAAAGTDAFYESWISTSGGNGVTSASTQSPTETQLAEIEGTILCSGSGNLAFLFGSEIATTQGVLIVAGSNAKVSRLS